MLYFLLTMTNANLINVEIKLTSDKSNNNYYEMNVQYKIN